MHVLLNFERYPQILFTLSRCPTLGATRKPDIVITAVAMSNLQSVIVHFKVPISDWYLAIPSSSRSGVLSSSGWSPFSNGDWNLCDGLTPKCVLNAFSIRSMYFLGPTQENVVLDRGVMSTASEVVLHDGLDMVDESHVGLSLRVLLEFL